MKHHTITYIETYGSYIIHSILTLINCIFFLILILTTLSSAEIYINSSSISSPTTIAFVADARPIFASNLSVLIEDFNQIIPQSPTGHVDAVVMIGDMDPIDFGIINTTAAYTASTAKNIPSFYVVGNHELENTLDLKTIKSRFAGYSFVPNPGPKGTRNTTYSFEVGDLHIVVLNEYWDGGSDSTCEWYTPINGSNVDDGCFKYSKENGGYISNELYNWINNDLNRNTRNWTIVVGHEPLYPQGTNHIGDSLDKNETNRNKSENLFKSKNITAFIGGHTHQSNLTIIDGIFHADAGAMGAQTHRSSPPNNNFATIIYTTVNEYGDFSIMRVYENPDWSSPAKTIFMKKPVDGSSYNSVAIKTAIVMIESVRIAITDIFGNFFGIAFLMILLILMILKKVIK